jgi:hypothetical protein
VHGIPLDVKSMGVLYLGTGVCMYVCMSKIFIARVIKIGGVCQARSNDFSGRYIGAAEHSYASVKSNRSESEFQLDSRFSPKKFKE